MQKIENFENSNRYRSEIHHLIPGGAHTYSKGDDQFPYLSPAAIKKGKGSRVWDIDNNIYLDCSMGLTSVSLGHAYPEVIEAVIKELQNGVNFQRPSALEKEMAEVFLNLIPCHDRIKFSKNGSTATTAAVKLARAHTGRKLVAFPGDHPFYSYDDWFIGKSACRKGVPEDTQKLSLTYNSNDLKTLKNLFDQFPGQISCVISEPEKITPMETEYCKKVQALCKKNGALFIIDEMVTGFKTGFPGSISKLGLDPDLATWGKGIANGFSFCALTGKKEIMDIGGILNEGAEKVFLTSTTHGGETHSLAACLATIEEFNKKNVIQHNHKIGEQIILKTREVLKSKSLDKYISITPENWLQGFTFRNKDMAPDLGYRTLFLQEMIKRGILFQGAFVPCFSHSQEDINEFSSAFSESCEIYAKALESKYQDFLVGTPIKPVFRKYL